MDEPEDGAEDVVETKRFATVTIGGA